MRIPFLALMSLIAAGCAAPAGMAPSGAPSAVPSAPPSPPPTAATGLWGVGGQFVPERPCIGQSVAFEGTAPAGKQARLQIGPARYDSMGRSSPGAGPGWLDLGVRTADAQGRIRWQIPLDNLMPIRFEAGTEYHFTLDGLDGGGNIAGRGFLTCPAEGWLAIVGTVYDADGKPVPGATVSIEPVDGGPAFRDHVTAADDGRYTLPALERGRRVAVRASWANGQAMRQVVNLGLPADMPGPLPLDLGPLPDLNGTWAFEDPGRPGPRVLDCGQVPDGFRFEDPGHDGKDVTITALSGPRPTLRGGLVEHEPRAGFGDIYLTWFEFRGEGDVPNADGTTRRETTVADLRPEPAARALKGQQGSARPMSEGGRGPLPVGYVPATVPSACPSPVR